MEIVLMLHLKKRKDALKMFLVQVFSQNGSVGLNVQNLAKVMSTYYLLKLTKEIV